MVFAVLTLACTVIGCRSGGMYTARGKKPEHYLTSNGDLTQQLEIQESNTIGGGSTDKFIVIEKDGKWKTYAMYIGGHLNSPQAILNPGKERTGQLSKAEITELAKILADNDLANLSSGVMQTNLDPHIIGIRFGERRISTDHLEGNGRLLPRYRRIADGVQNIIEKNGGKK